jgi:hypothetical protein
MFLEQQQSEAVPWLRWLFAGLSPWTLGLAPRTVYVGSVADWMALGQVFLRVLWFSPNYIIPPWLSILINNIDINNSSNKSRNGGAMWPPSVCLSTGHNLAYKNGKSQKSTTFIWNILIFFVLMFKNVRLKINSDRASHLQSTVSGFHVLSRSSSWFNSLIRLLSNF